MSKQVELELARLHERVEGLVQLSDAKFVTLRTLVDSQVERAALALAASDKAVIKAEAATEKRFEGVNEFRAQLTDQAARFVTRETVNARLETLDHSKDSAHEALSARISALERTLERQQGRGAGLAAGWGYIVTAMGLALTVATLVIIFTR